jgi:hypothetical protein
VLRLELTTQLPLAAAVQGQRLMLLGELAVLIPYLALLLQQVVVAGALILAQALQLV